jgi:hypothetical protein
MLFGDESALEPKKSKSVDEVMSELKTPLSSFKKIIDQQIFAALESKRCRILRTIKGFYDLDEQ